MNITLEQAIEIARVVEKQLLLFNYNNAHCALGGSCLHKGRSDKDVDIIVYPHKSEYPYSIDKMIELLTLAGFNTFQERDHAAYGDGKTVYLAYYNGTRVDFFFLEAKHKK